MKAFILEDFEKKYDQTTFTKIPGKSPEMMFLNDGGEVLERLDIAQMSRQELNNLMEAKGFKRTDSASKPTDEL